LYIYKRCVWREKKRKWSGESKNPATRVPEEDEEEREARDTVVWQKRWHLRLLGRRTLSASCIARQSGLQIQA
jgi:hypothetical protein